MVEIAHLKVTLDEDAVLAAHLKALVSEINRAVQEATDAGLHVRIETHGYLETCIIGHPTKVKRRAGPAIDIEIVRPL